MSSCALSSGLRVRVGSYKLSPDERAAVEEGLAQADRGEFVSDQEMDAFFDDEAK
jgi:predicted transcriptional regulator